MIKSKSSTVREFIAHFLKTESAAFAENCRYILYKNDSSVFAGMEGFVMLSTVLKHSLNMLAISIPLANCVN